MIKYTSTRHDGRHQHTISHNKKQGDAVVTLVQFELGFGGQLTAISPTQVTVRTPVFGMFDVVTFEGSEDDMRPLIAASRVFYELRGLAPKDYAVMTLEPLRRDTGGFRPFDVAMFGSLLGGMGFVKPTLLSLICSEPAQIEAALKQPVEEVAAAVEMGLNDNDPSGAIALLT